MTRIAYDGTPDLLARLKVARKDGHAVRTTHGRVNAVARARVAVKNCVHVGDKIFNPSVSKQVFDAGFVSAFGKPDTTGLAPKMFAVVCDSDTNLRAFSFRRGDKRKKAMRCAAGDYLKHTLVLKLTKGADQIAIIAVVPERKRRAQRLVVHSSY